MANKKYEYLLSPIQIAGQLFKNRYFAAPIGYCYHPVSDHPNHEAIAWYERKAAGGAASVNVGFLAADNARGCVGPMMRLDDPTALPALYRLTRSVTNHGAVCVGELMHAGANSYYSKMALGNEIYGAVSSTNALGMEVPEMPEEIILETIEKFADAAAFAKYAGFGMITVHAGHGWLLNEFMGRSNTRTDKWGGDSIENRCRIVVAIIDRIHEKCGRDFPVDVRITGSEDFEGGYDVGYGIEIAKQLDGHADMIGVSCGHHEKQETFTLTHPSMFVPDNSHVKIAAEIKKHVKYSIVGAVGAISDPEYMNRIIGEGLVDVVMVAREMICDPDLPLKLMTNRDKEIRKCLRCFECFKANSGYIQMQCAINPEIGQERETSIIPPLRYKKRILIAGGGISGMQAALTAEERGHEVILFEKEGRLGGILRCEKDVPFKKHLDEYLDLQAYLLEKSSVDIHLNTKVTPSICKEYKPDVIIAALGAIPKELLITGAEKNNVMNAVTAYNNVNNIGNDVAVLGGGLVGMELAIYLAQEGKKVKILEMADRLNDSGNFIHGLAISLELAKYNIDIFTSTKAVEITEEGVIGEYVGDKYSVPDCPTINAAIQASCCFGVTFAGEVEIGSKKLYKADTIITAAGLDPLIEEALSLKDYAPEFYQVGDCISPKNIFNATRTAYTLARDIGSKY